MADKVIVPSWKTTRFWSKVIVQLGLLVTAFQGFVDPKTAAVIIALLEVATNIIRAIENNPEITTIVDNSITTTK